MHLLRQWPRRAGKPTAHVFGWPSSAPFRHIGQPAVLRNTRVPETPASGTVPLPTAGNGRKNQNAKHHENKQRHWLILKVIVTAQPPPSPGAPGGDDAVTDFRAIGLPGTDRDWPEGADFRHARSRQPAPSAPSSRSITNRCNRYLLYQLLSCWRLADGPVMFILQTMPPDSLCRTNKNTGAVRHLSCCKETS